MTCDSIAYDEEALSLRPPGHADRLDSLKNLADSLRTRYTKLGEISDLDKSIVLAQEAVELIPDGHPDKEEFYLITLQEALEV